MADDACERIFFVGKDRTAVETTGIDAMVASGSDVLLNGGRTNEQSDTAPRLGFVKAIERMTRGDAGFAAGTFFEVYFEGVLLTRLRLRKRNKAAVRLVARKLAPQIVPVGEPIDGRPLAFLSEESVDKRAWTLSLFDWWRKHRHSID
jgi:hypothetical protein